MQAHSAFRERGAQRLHGPRTRLSVREVLADNHFADAGADDHLHERDRGIGGEGRIEGLLYQIRDAAPGDQLPLARLLADQRRRVARREQARRMGLERQGACRTPGVAAYRGKQRLVAEMHAVEVSDGHRAAFERPGRRGEAWVDPHRRGLRAHGERPPRAVRRTRAALRWPFAGVRMPALAARLSASGPNASGNSAPTSVVTLRPPLAA